MQHDNLGSELLSHCVLFFFFNDTATTEIYTLSLHDALPIEGQHCSALALYHNHPLFSCSEGGGRKRASFPFSFSLFFSSGGYPFFLIAHDKFGCPLGTG